MADQFPGTTGAERDFGSNDLISILNREAREALRRIADQLYLPDKLRTGPEASSKYQLVCQVYAARRERTQIFDADLFAEPGWDILLAMFREHLAGRPMTLADVINAADAPSTTAARWIEVLERRTLIVRAVDRDQIELSSTALEKLEAYVERLRTKALMRLI